MSPVGIASATFKHGLFSKAMPHGMAERFRQAATDPELLSLSRDVALIDTRLLEVLKSLDQSGFNFDAVVKAKNALVSSQQVQDINAMKAELGDLVRLIEASEGEMVRWLEIERLIEGRRKLIDSLQKHQVQSAQIVTLMQMQILFSGLAQLVRKAFVGLMSQLQDEREKKAAQKALSEISRGFQSLTMSSAPAVAGTVTVQ